jgi:hypothetical protein
MPRPYGSGFSYAFVAWKPELCHGLGDARAKIISVSFEDLPTLVFPHLRKKKEPPRLIPLLTLSQASASAGPEATDASPQAETEISLSFRDVNPFPPLLLILKRRNNIATLFVSGMQFPPIELPHLNPRSRIILCLHDHPHVYMRTASRESL